jgi:hypothetical protein
MGFTGLPPDAVLHTVLYAKALPFFTFDFMIAEERGATVVNSWAGTEAGSSHGCSGDRYGNLPRPL